MNTYEQQAQDFLAATGTEFKAAYIEHGKHFEDDTSTRDIYRITLKRGRMVYSFNFGQSIEKSVKYEDAYGFQKRKFMCDGSIIGTGRKLIDAETLQNNKDYRPIKGTAPTAYDVLACITKYNPGEFEDFCADYGYDTDSRKAKKVYKAVVKEWLKVSAMFNAEELEQLAEVQ